MSNNAISLFSGVGMLDLAAEAFGFHTVATAEIDPWNRSVLAARFPDAQHFEDVRLVTAEALKDSAAGAEGVGLVMGGFPCQDLSVAGHGAGLAGDRSGLWSEFARVIEEFEPTRVLIENVAVLRSRGLNAVLWDLDRHGYDVWWDCVPAAAVGAPHMRDRIWVQAVRRQDRRPLDGLAAGGKPLGHITAHAFGVSKMPRAGRMTDGMLYEEQTKATQKQARESVEAGQMLLPSPSATEPGWRNLVIRDRDGNTPEHPNQRFYDAKNGRVVQKGVAQIAAMFPDLSPASHELLPTPTVQDASNNGGPGQMRRNSLPLNAYVKLFPTPRAAANEWRTTKNAPSHGKTHGATLAGTINDAERAAGRTPARSSESAGNLSPRWVEWMMGLPQDWTNPDVPNDKLVPFAGWGGEPTPRTEDDAPHRRKRLAACGNGLVPQVACVALAELTNR